MIRGHRPFFLAEREGFEPSVEVSPNTRLAGERLQPTRPSLRNSSHQLPAGSYQLKTIFVFGLKGYIPRLLAASCRLPAGSGGGRGIRTPGPAHHGTTVFKTAAFNLSAIPPANDF